MEESLEVRKQIELYQVKWLLGQVLALIALLGVFTLDLGIDRVGLLVFAVVLLSILQPRWIQRISKRARPLLLGVVVIFVVVDFIGSGTDFIPPLARMIIWLLAIRLVEYRSRREDLQVILLSLFLVVAGGVLSMELSFALQLLLYCPLAMVTLFLVTLDESNRGMKEVPSEPFHGFRWRAFLRWIGVSVDRRLLVFSTILFIGFSLMAAILFVALPRFEFGKSLPFMQMRATSSFSGFSETVVFGDVVDIQKDDRVALRVDIASGRPEEVPYWRMVALDEYFWEGFRQSLSSRDQNRIYSNYEFGRSKGAATALSGDAAWVFYLEGGVSRYLPIPGDYRELTFQSRQDVEFNSLLDLVQLKATPSSVLFYQLKPVDMTRYTQGWGRDLKIDKLDQAIYSKVGGEVEPSRIHYPETLMVLPDDGISGAKLGESIEMIRRDYGAWESAFSFGAKATAWLQSKHGYALQAEIPGGEGNRIIRWLESEESGHCELFAGSLIFLAREAGIPARMVNGFHGGDWNGYENYYMVRNLNAHAWVELYDREKGWIRVDPTPVEGIDGSSGAGRQTAMNIDRTMRAYLDSLRVVWYRRVVNFDQDQQRDLAKGVSHSLETGIEWVKVKVKGNIEVFKNWIKQPVGSEGWWRIPVYVMGMMGIFILLKRSLTFGMQWFYARGGKYDYRRKMAERLLSRLLAIKRPLDVRGERIRNELMMVRFGDEREWVDWRKLFKEANGYVRRERWRIKG